MISHLKFFATGGSRFAPHSENGRKLLISWWYIYSRYHTVYAINTLYFI